MRRVCLLTCAVVATPKKTHILSNYAAEWAAGGTDGRCGTDKCEWMKRFGAIDTGCGFDVRAGLSEDFAESGPALSFVLADDSRLAVSPGDAEAAARFRDRPILCEYVAGGGRKPATASTDVALLMVASSSEYLFRLWPLFLNKLLYASDTGLRPFLWIGDLPPALHEATSPECLDSYPARLFRNETGRRRLGQSFYDGHISASLSSVHDVSWVSNHYIKMPAAIATSRPASDS